jgi:hypothetical protein
MKLKKDYKNIIYDLEKQISIIYDFGGSRAEQMP